VFDLLLITDGTRPREIVGAVQDALRGATPGRVAVQLRAKQSGSAELLELARALRMPTRERGALLLINDRVDIAKLVDADGVQLPERGLPVAEARRLLGTSALIGVSCHGTEGLALALASGASFATLSPVFATAGKGEPLGVARFAALSGEIPLPIYALGGIKPEHLPTLRAAGASGVAVISAVFAADDRAAAVAACLASWDAPVAH
jgi:thiamine-phosphate pyrophosphorylase